MNNNNNKEEEEEEEEEEESLKYKNNDRHGAKILRDKLRNGFLNFILASARPTTLVA